MSIATPGELAAWRSLMTGYRDDEIFVSLAEVLGRPAWHADAACRGQGPQVFFTAYGRNPETALALCSTCPVRDQCGDAGRAGPDGIWGGRRR